MMEIIVTTAAAGVEGQDEELPALFEEAIRLTKAHEWIATPGMYLGRCPFCRGYVAFIGHIYLCYFCKQKGELRELVEKARTVKTVKPFKKRGWSTVLKF